jgi:hypothetical protein
VSEKQKCLTCRFFLPDPQFFGSGYDPDKDGPMEEPGYCLRYPPSMLADPGRMVNRDGTRDTRAHPRRPEVYLTDWCGEWQAANPTAVDDAATVMARHVLAGDAGAARQLADKLIELIPLPVVTPQE